MEERSRTATHTGPTEARPLKPGTVVGDRFTVLGPLGTGGMGTVYRARDSLLGDEVALKAFRVELDERHAERFRREVSIGREPHPNLVRTHDVGEWNGSPYLAMELVDGEALRERIARDGALPDPEVEQLADALLSGLAHLHARRIVHRDVTAGNVLLTREGEVKLADFGLARGAGDATVTHTQTTLGTPGYMAPEQIRGDEVGPPSDLYSLGVVLWEAAVGERPFTGDSYATVLHQHLRESPDPRRLSGVSPRLRRLILRLLEKEPRRRYADAGACLSAWREGRVRRKLRIRGPRLLLGAAALLVSAAVLAPPLLLDARRVEVRSDGLVGVNALGGTAWTRDLGTVVTARAVPRTDSGPPGFLVAAEPRSGDRWSQRVVLIDRRGHGLRSLELGARVDLLRDLGVPGSLSIHRFLPPTDLVGIGMPELTAVIAGAPWYMSFIGALFEGPSGPKDLTPLVYNPGLIEWARFIDADGDGQREWYVAAMDNELLHTAAVYRADAGAAVWPPPRLGAGSGIAVLRWFTPLSRRGGQTFGSVEVARGGSVSLTLQDGSPLRLDAWGNPDGSFERRDAELVSRERLERYRELSRAHLLLLEDEVEGAERVLSRLEAPFSGDSVAEGFRLLLTARVALRRGDAERADALAAASFATAPIANDALLLRAKARIVGGRPGTALELLGPDTSVTRGSPADSQEMRGVVAWLEGRDESAWRAFQKRLRLPTGLAMQHRARLLLGQGRWEDALEELSDRRDVKSHERLDLLEAVALGLGGRFAAARTALGAERDRHPWLYDETEVVAVWLDSREGGGSVERLSSAVSGVIDRARWDLYAHLDLPLLLPLAADAFRGLGEPVAAARCLDRAASIRPPRAGSVLGTG